MLGADYCQQTSHIDALLSMALQIPARRVSLARKQRVDAGLRLRRIEDEFSLAAFLRYRIVAADGDLSVGLPIRGDPVAEYRVVHSISQRRQAQCGREPNQDHSQQQTLEFGTRHLGHRRAIIPASRRAPVARLYCFSDEKSSLVDNSPLAQAN